MEISVIAEKAAAFLRAGEIVAVPTETVYGLAANALNPVAVAKIFAVKKRPQDNPLIVHVSGLEAARGLGLEIPPLAEKLAEKFWAGPLTMIFRRLKGCEIPDIISCGLDTVAVRVPANAIFLAVIAACGFPIAAPSANLSGSPSPTTAQHVRDDFGGKIPFIADGGACEIGIESTIIAFHNDSGGGEKIRLLRPGAITPEMLSAFAEVVVDGAAYAKTAVTASPECPGTAHKHYSPKAEVIAVAADTESEFLSKCGATSYSGAYGGKTALIPNPETHTLFAKFREYDQMGVNRVYVRLPKPEGVGLALYNRIVRSAEFDIL